MKYAKVLPFLMAIFLCGCSTSVPSEVSQTETAAMQSDIFTTEPSSAEITTLNTENWHIDPDEVITYYDTYEAFAEMMQHEYPDYYLYQPPENPDFQIKDISFHDEAFYRMHFSFDDGKEAGIEVLCLSTYSDISEFKKIFDHSVNVEGNTLEDSGANYAFEHYSDGPVTLMGLAGDDHTLFVLMDVSEDKPDDPAEQEKELVDLYTRLGFHDGTT